MNRRLSDFPSIVILTVLATVGVLIALPAFQQPSSAAPSPLRTIPNTDVNPYGADVFLHLEVEPWKIEKTLRMLKEAGIGWIFQQFLWEELEPKKGRFWNDASNRPTWEKYDRIVDMAIQYGLKIVARLDRPPDWTRQDNSRKESPPDNFADYGDFVYQVAKRYEGRISYYQLWNEPNIYPEWGNRPVDPKGYVELLKEGYRRVKEADPNAFVLAAPLAQTLENSPFNMSDLVFLEEMYRNGAKDYFDILLANAYGFSEPPEDPANPQKLNFARFSLLRGIMDRYGDKDKAIWLHEFGWNAAPPDLPAERLKWGRVGDQEQALYTIRAIQQARSQWEWVGVFGIWYFRQPGNYSPDQAEYYFRAIDVGFTPRPLYRAVKEAIQGLDIAGPGAYEESNPALTTKVIWQERIYPKASGKALKASESPGAALNIAFRGSSIALLLWKNPESAIAEVTIDGGRANQLPTDRQSSSIDLYSPEPVQAKVTVAAGLGGGTHNLQLTVASQRNPRSQGSWVAIDGFEVGPAQRPISNLLIGSLIVLAALLLSIWRLFFTTG